MSGANIRIMTEKKICQKKIPSEMCLMIQSSTSCLKCLQKDLTAYWRFCFFSNGYTLYINLNRSFLCLNWSSKSYSSLCIYIIPSRIWYPNFQEVVRVGLAQGGKMKVGARSWFTTSHKLVHGLHLPLVQELVPVHEICAVSKHHRGRGSWWKASL